MGKKKQIEEAVESLVKDRMALNTEYCKTALLTDMGIDSLDMLEMVMNLEKQYQVFIPENIYEQIKTPQDIIDKLTAVLKI